MIHIADDHGYDFDLLRGVITVNEEQFERVTNKVSDLAGGSLEGVRVAAWGLTFKARTDDLRESPALEVIRRLNERGAEVVAYDPAVETAPEGVTLAADLYAACEGANVLVVLTEWDDFRWPDFDKVAELMADRRVVDSRNILDRAALERLEFDVVGIGRT
jgi:UDPglucose 6-dehydrogenase